MGNEHLCKNCVYTIPEKSGKECGNGYLYLEPKVACVGFKALSSVDLYNDGCYNSSTIDGADYGMSDASSSDLYVDPDTTIRIATYTCDKCEKEIGHSEGFHIWPDPNDEDDDQIEFHLHAKCFKWLLKKLINLRE